MGGYTRAVSKQRLGKHVPVAGQKILNNATVGLQQWKNCFLRGPCLYVTKGQGQLIFLYVNLRREDLSPEI
jgi:hypothetical protein